MKNGLLTQPGFRRPAAPMAGRRTLGGISLLLVVAFACSGAVRADQGMFLQVARAAEHTARHEVGFQRPTVRVIVSRRQFVPSVARAGELELLASAGAHTNEYTASFGALSSLELPLHLIDMPPPSA